MKKRILWMFAAILTCGLTMTSLSSCISLSDNPTTTEADDGSARVTETLYYNLQKTTVYKFEYASTDPYGNPCMLSGVITVGDEVTKQTPARGILLYNHFTIFRADQCPSAGNLAVQKLMSGSGLITVSADYYGFGITNDKNQAYCISEANAQASVDALLAARKLLTKMGYTWDDVLFNAGYSQGGQTTMAVLRLVTQKYPDIRFTYTFAGGGSYDIPETYRQFILSGETAMPATVIGVLLAYNEYFNLGIPYSDIFTGSTLNNIDEWMFSKQYSGQEINDKIGSNALATFITPTMLDLESDLSKQFMQVLDTDNLSKGWQVRKGEKITLVHNLSDAAVPAANTEKMYQFFANQGLNVSKNKADNPDIYVLLEDMGSELQPAHETGALVFINETIATLCQILNITPWVTITPDMMISL